MRLSPYLRPELVRADLSAADNLQAIERLVDVLVAAEPELDRQCLLDALLDREQQVSTGLESGVAVPHATVEGVHQTVLVIGRLAQPVDFGTLDGSPVRFIFMMLSPPGAIASHIRLLARIARLCSLPEFIEAMERAAGDAGLLEAIRQEDARHV
jgi:mannitol/fructose-specific phosphotransferase system IIA component (Ntr-type)